MSRRAEHVEFPLRRRLVMTLFAVSAVVLAWRAVDLQLTQKEWLQHRGSARYLRTVASPAIRGMITDRNGEPLAVSTPVQSVAADPSELARRRDLWPALAALIDTTEAYVDSKVTPRVGQHFVYLRRHVTPETARRLAAAAIPGVRLVEEQRRYYPGGEVTSHLLGFTNVDDAGQEGIELAFDGLLRGADGARRVIKDNLGRIVEEIDWERHTVPGRDLALSIDKRIQYIAYRELKAAVQAHEAVAGSLAVVDVTTGEILALAVQPSFNPNNRDERRSQLVRNRAAADVFEPGSTLKPFTIAAGLESGVFAADAVVNTAPGFFKVGSNTVRDHRNYGRLDIGGIIEKSSNVGASKIALAMEPVVLWDMLDRAGLGHATGVELPSEAAGFLNTPANWREIEHATLAFGYGASVTVLQLARAYTILAADGLRRDLTLVRRDTPMPARRVYSVETTRRVRAMLERVVTHGTGTAAAVPGYRVAGKTGTVHKVTPRGYAKDRYLSVFAGMMPAGRPRLVAVIMIDEPRGGEYYGGQVAAPAFSRLMRDAARVLNLAPSAPTRGPTLRLAEAPAGGAKP